MIEFSKIDANGQITIPEAILKATHIGEGSILAWALTDDGGMVCKPVPAQMSPDHLMLMQSFTEWFSPEDKEAFRNLQCL